MLHHHIVQDVLHTLPRNRVIYSVATASPRLFDECKYFVAERLKGFGDRTVDRFVASGFKFTSIPHREATIQILNRRLGCAPLEDVKDDPRSRCFDFAHSLSNHSAKIKRSGKIPPSVRSFYCKLPAPIYDRQRPNRQLLGALAVLFGGCKNKVGTGTSDTGDTSGVIIPLPTPRIKAHLVDGTLYIFWPSRLEREMKVSQAFCRKQFNDLLFCIDSKGITYPGRALASLTDVFCRPSQGDHGMGYKDDKDDSKGGNGAMTMHFPCPAPEHMKRAIDGYIIDIENALLHQCTRAHTTFPPHVPKR